MSAFSSSRADGSSSRFATRAILTATTAVIGFVLVVLMIQVADDQKGARTPPGVLACMPKVPPRPGVFSFLCAGATLDQATSLFQTDDMEVVALLPIREYNWAGKEQGGGIIIAYGRALKK